MKIKVCGMKYSRNIAELEKLPIDLMGLIYYPKSPRYIGDEEVCLVKNTKLKRVGVFVNEQPEMIAQRVKASCLSLIQLHGQESVGTCKELSQLVPVIKAFGITNETDFSQTQPYEKVCSLFLFDTQTSAYGGSGKQFNWKSLESYNGNTPFLLSGGISIKDVQRIKKINHPMLYGVDLNSCFEITPGLKDINLLKQFIKEIKS